MTLQNTDIMLANRGGESYRVPVSDIKTFIGDTVISTPYIMAPSNGAGTSDPSTAVSTSITFEASTPQVQYAGAAVTWSQATWELTRTSDASVVTKSYPISNPAANQTAPGVDFNLDLNTEYSLRVKYSCSVPSGESSYSASVSFKTENIVITTQTTTNPVYAVSWHPATSKYYALAGDMNTSYVFSFTHGETITSFHQAFTFTHYYTYGAANDAVVEVASSGEGNYVHYAGYYDQASGSIGFARFNVDTDSIEMNLRNNTQSRRTTNARWVQRLGRSGYYNAAIAGDNGTAGGSRDYEHTTGSYSNKNWLSGNAGHIYPIYYPDKDSGYLTHFAGSNSHRRAVNYYSFVGDSTAITSNTSRYLFDVVWAPWLNKYITIVGEGGSRQNPQKFYSFRQDGSDPLSTIEANPSELHLITDNPGAGVPAEGSILISTGSSLWAFCGQHAYSSTDGVSWIKRDLPYVSSNALYRATAYNPTQNVFVTVAQSFASGDAGMVIQWNTLPVNAGTFYNERTSSPILGSKIKALYGTDPNTTNLKHLGIYPVIEAPAGYSAAYYVKDGDHYRAVANEHSDVERMAIYNIKNTAESVEQAVANYSSS